MKALSKYIVIKCPKCIKKARYNLPVKVELQKNSKYIGDFGIQSKVNSFYKKIPIGKLNEYRVVYSFGGMLKKEISLKKVIDEDYLTENTTYRSNKKKIGWVNCLHCGFSNTILFDRELYFYQISVKDFVIYARTFEALEGIRNTFKHNIQLRGDPELDYPKKFWQNKDEIVRRIENFMEKEKS